MAANDRKRAMRNGQYWVFKPLVLIFDDVTYTKAILSDLAYHGSILLINTYFKETLNLVEHTNYACFRLRHKHLPSGVFPRFPPLHEISALSCDWLFHCLRFHNCLIRCPKVAA